MSRTGLPERKPSSFIWDRNDDVGNEGWVNCGRYALVVSNVLFFVLGAFMLCFGVWFNFVPANQNIIAIAVTTTTRSYMKVSMYLVEATGVCTIILALVGCCAAISNTKYILGMFFLFLVALFVQLVTVASLSLWLRVWVRVDDDISYQMRKTLMESYRGDDAQNRESIAWREVQKEMKCCGFSEVDGFRDYKNKSDEYPDGSAWWKIQQRNDQMLIKREWPDSCCIEGAAIEGKDCHAPDGTHVFRVGCCEKLRDFINQNLLVVTVMAIMLCFIEMVHFITFRQLEAIIDNPSDSSGTSAFFILDDSTRQFNTVSHSSKVAEMLLERAKTK